MAARSLLHTHITGLGKTRIGLVGDPPYFGKLWPEVADTVVGRIVVNHEHLSIQVPGRLPHRVQALFQEILYVIVYYDNGYCHESGHNIDHGFHGFNKDGKDFIDFWDGFPNVQMSRCADGKTG